MHRSFYKKYCWIATETKRGWKLGFCLGDKPPKYIRGIYTTIKGIAQIRTANTVFVHRKTAHAQ